MKHVDYETFEVIEVENLQKYGVEVSDLVEWMQNIKDVPQSISSYYYGVKPIDYELPFNTRFDYQQYDYAIKILDL